MLLQKKASGICSGRLLEILEWSKVYFMPELLELADFAPGSMLRMPSVADTAITEPSRRVRTTGK